MRQQMYFYVSGYFYNEKKGRYEEGTIGPYNTHDEAMQSGYEKSINQLEIVEFPSSDINKVTRMIKAKKLEDGESYGEAVCHIRHSGKDIGVKGRDYEKENINY